MSDPFTGIRLKRARAWDQINGLKPDFFSFLDAEPYVPRVHFDKATGTLTTSVHVNRAPDPIWGVRVGEIVHNLRSALDHLVWELVILNTKRPPPEDNKNQFPIFKTKAGFQSRGIPQNLAGVAITAIAVIQSEQPFPTPDGGTGEDFARSPLWHLRQLSNHDKHRMLHVTGSMVTAFHFQTPPLKFGARTFTLEKRDVGPVQEDAILNRTRFVHDPGGQIVTEWPFTSREIKGDLTVDVAFDQRTPTVGGWLVFATLVDIANRTDRILRRIATEIFKIDL